MATLSHQEAVLRGRIGGFAAAAANNTHELTLPARKAFLAKFERQVDPHQVLPEEERKRRAMAARKAHFARLALKSAQKRRRNALRGEKD
jgi:hypothetical protein